MGAINNPSAGRQSQVNEQLAVLEEQAKRYDELVSKANERLCSVIRLEPPTGLTNEKEPVNLVPLAQRIKTLTSEINKTSTRLESLIDRTEN